MLSPMYLHCMRSKLREPNLGNIIVMPIYGWAIYPVAQELGDAGTWVIVIF